MAAIPTVHLNGTSKASLMREAGEAMDAVRKAYEALARMTVHMRDFYVQPNGSAAFAQYLAAHSARLRRLDDIQQELGTIARAIDAQDR